LVKEALNKSIFVIPANTQRAQEPEPYRETPAFTRKGQAVVVSRWIPKGLRSTMGWSPCGIVCGDNHAPPGRRLSSNWLPDQVRHDEPSNPRCLL